MLKYDIKAMHIMDLQNSNLEVSRLVFASMASLLIIWIAYSAILRKIYAIDFVMNREFTRNFFILSSGISQCLG